MKMTKQEISINSLSLLQQALLLVAILVGLYLIGQLIYLLTPVLTPFIIAAVLAYLTDPLVERLSQGKWKVSRVLAVIFVFALVILLFLLAILFLIPALEKQLIYLATKVPETIDWLQKMLLPQLMQYGMAPEDLSLNTLKTELAKHISEAQALAKWLWQKLFHSGLAILTWFMNILIIFVATFYLLRDWRKILLTSQALLPKIAKPKVLKLAHQCDAVLSTFVRGQLSVMAALGVFYGIGLAVIGVNFSLLLGLMAGFLSIVPYLGSILCLGLALGVTYLQFHALMPIIAVLILFGLGHILEGMILTPLLIGDKLGLHPVVVIFAVLAGGHLLGFVGVVLALPLTAILVVIARELLWGTND